jgi:hypothetical protein
VQIIDLVESFREMAVSLMEVHLSSVSNRLNEVMRVLTVISTIFIPLTFLVGVYGMNFDYMPELRWRWAYPALWAVMIGLGVGMFAIFRRRGWIGTGRERDAGQAEQASRRSGGAGGRGPGGGSQIVKGPKPSASEPPWEGIFGFLPVGSRPAEWCHAPGAFFSSAGTGLATARAPQRSRPGIGRPISTEAALKMASSRPGRSRAAGSTPRSGCCARFSTRMRVGGVAAGVVSCRRAARIRVGRPGRLLEVARFQDRSVRARDPELDTRIARRITHRGDHARLAAQRRGGRSSALMRPAGVEIRRWVDP